AADGCTLALRGGRGVRRARHDRSAPHARRVVRLGRVHPTSAQCPAPGERIYLSSVSRHAPAAARTMTRATSLADSYVEVGERAVLLLDHRLSDGSAGEPRHRLRGRPERLSVAGGGGAGARGTPTRSARASVGPACCSTTPRCKASSKAASVSCF